MSDGQTLTVAFSSIGLSWFQSESASKDFLHISRSIYIPYASIEKISREEVYVKGSGTALKIGRTYFGLISYSLYNHLKEYTTKMAD